MLYAVRADWALLVGILLLMLGNGLQGSLLGVRATMAGFPTAVTGIVMSGYYIGFLGGSTLVPALIARVGHIRVFAALGSLASVSILVHSIEVDPVTWFVMRFITGVALCGLYLTAESWLNSKATNEIRAKILSVYMVIQLGGLAGGQFLLNLASPAGYRLFILVSILLSIAVIPILLTASPAPVISASRHVRLRQLYRASPLATVAIFSIGAAQGALFAMGAVYAREIGLPVAGISALMALSFLGGMVFQWPLGVLSDRLDRRKVIVVTTFLAAAVAAVTALASGGPAWSPFVLFFLMAGLSLPMYSMCVAHANDFMTTDQMVGASGALLLVNGTGAILGPIIGSDVMQVLGPWGLPLFVATAHGLIGFFALWRMTRRAARPLALQGPTIVVQSSGTSAATAIVQEAAVQKSPVEPPGPKRTIEAAV
jgi:MFS family permease